ncbi:hypothetical protein [Anoxynatronum sibiricum]|uniref:Uncharacterized protein n=1 Tax=Anoxynatronum sibiricum TaxID=210623 RepID=A0ABU9VR68_9CLOT
MKLKEVLAKRDQLKNQIYALKRSIALCQIHLKDEEMIQDLTDIKAILDSEFNDLSNGLQAIEEIEM